LRRKPHHTCEAERRDMDIAAARGSSARQIAAAVFVADH
jgi:hypothetical protein